MKKILFRKLLLDYLTFAFFALISTSIVIWVFQAVNYLDIIIEDGRDYFVYLNYTLLNFPKIISRILPFAFFFSFLFTINKYETNNELIIFWNFGFEKIKFVNFFFKFSIFLLLFQIFLTAIIVPYTQNISRSYLKTSNINMFENFIKPKKFNDTIKGLTIYADKKNKNGFLENIYLKQIVNDESKKITFAKRGKFQTINDINLLVLFEGETITFQRNNITSFTFSKSDFNLDGLNSNTILNTKTQEYSSKDLILCAISLSNEKYSKLYKERIGYSNCKKENMDNIYAELYKRIIIPFYIPILMLICTGILATSKENLNYLKFKFLIYFFGFITIIISETSLRFVGGQFYYNMNLVTIPFLVIIFLYTILYFKFNFKKLN